MNSATWIEQELKKGAKGGAVVLSGLVAGQLLNYATKVLIARFWGPTNYGLINLGLAVLSIGSAIVLLGLPTGVARFVAFHQAGDEREQLKNVLFTALCIGTLSGSVIGVALFFYADRIAIGVFHAPEFGPMLKVFAFAVIFSVLLRLLTAGLQGFEDMTRMVYSQNIIPQGGVFSLVLICLLFNFQASALPYAYLFSLVGSMLAALLLLQRHVRPLSALPSEMFENSKQLLAFSWPLILADTLLQFRYQTDRIMLGTFLDPTQVGIYSSATPIMWGLFLISGAFSPLMLPLLTRLYRIEAQKEFKFVFLVINRWIFYISLPLILLIVIFPGPIIGLIFGHQYLAAAPALRILALGALMFYLSGFGGSLITAVGQTKTILLIEALGTGTNVLLNYLLIPRLGIEGAALATFASFLVNSLLVIAFIRKRMNFWVFNGKWAKYAFSFASLFFALSTLAAHLMPSANGAGLLLAAFVAMVISAMVGLKAAGLSPEDWVLLRAIRRKFGLLHSL